MVHVERRLASPKLGTELVTRAASQTLALEGASGDLTIVLTDDAQLRELNHKYLGVDATTDVLSFASGEADPETGKTYLGDVVLSVPRARAQATVAGHKLEAEVQLLVIHGVLHLLGYDHAEAVGKAKMWAAQDQALNKPGPERHRHPGIVALRKFTRSRVRSFGHAFEGWWYALRTQRNAWLEVGIACGVFAVSIWLQLDTVRWAIIVLTTALVFAAEFFNTAVEVMVDLVSPQHHPLAKTAKDVAAAAVLVTAFGAVLIGFLLLGPPLMQRLQVLIAR